MDSGVHAHGCMLLCTPLPASDTAKYGVCTGVMRLSILKAMALPWILRQIAKALPQPDNVFFRDDEGYLRSHSTTLGKTTEEIYIQGGSMVQTFNGVSTTVTYRWEGKGLTCVLTRIRPNVPESLAPYIGVLGPGLTPSRRIHTVRRP